MCHCNRRRRPHQVQKAPRVVKTRLVCPLCGDGPWCLFLGLHAESFFCHSCRQTFCPERGPLTRLRVVEELPAYVFDADEED